MKKWLIICFSVFLFAVILNGENIKSLADQSACKKLADIAKNDKKWKVREAAVKMIDDQAVLADIARTDSDQDVRKAAMEKITEQAVLAEIAKSDSQMSETALGKLTDPLYLLDVAKNAADVEIRENAIDELKDQTAIAAVVKSEPDWHAQIGALLKLEDSALLAEIAKDRLPTARDIESGKLELLPGETVRTVIRTGRTVTSTWSSPEGIETIKINPGSVEFEGQLVTDIPTLAALRLKDKAMLADVAKRAFRTSARLAAVEKLTDQVVLAEIAKNDDQESVRRAAEERLRKLQEK
jgi:hypothetical protein